MFAPNRGRRHRSTSHDSPVCTLGIVESFRGDRGEERVLHLRTAPRVHGLTHSLIVQSTGASAPWRRYFRLGRRSGGGRWSDHREVIDAIALRFQTGTQWVHLPEKYHRGPDGGAARSQCPRSHWSRRPGPRQAPPHCRDRLRIGRLHHPRIRRCRWIFVVSPPFGDRPMAWSSG
jgi:hypothetical protein